MGKKKLIEGIRKFKKDLSKVKRVEKVILFGSRAEGTFTGESDVDLIIVSPDFRGIKSGRAYGLRRYWTPRYPVDFICYTPEEFNRLRKEVSIVSEALKKGIVI